MPPDTPVFPSVHFDNLSEIETSYWWHQSRLNWAEWMIRRWVPNTSCQDVIDFGCGTGGFLHALCQRFSFQSYLGVDVSPKAIDLARNYGTHYQQIQSRDYSSARGKSLLLLMDTLEHIEDDEAFLSGAMAPLRNDGKVLISVPAMPRSLSKWDKALGHFRRYSKGSLTKLVEKSGGEIIDVRHIFSYLVPIIYLRRILMNQNFNETNCEFPPVLPFLDRLLLWCNRSEIFIANWGSLPVGSSLLCLAKKAI